MRVCAGVGRTDPLPDCTRPFSYQEINMQLVQQSRLLVYLWMRLYDKVLFFLFKFYDLNNIMDR